MVIISLIMVKQKSKDHAIHNELACIYLDKCTDFPDWVITTSFYSSLHFLQHKLFPIKVGLGKIRGKTQSVVFDDFESYHLFKNNRENLDINKTFVRMG